jgi:hypothetical protein
MVGDAVGGQNAAENLDQLRNAGFERKLKAGRRIAIIETQIFDWTAIRRA